MLYASLAANVVLLLTVLAALGPPLPAANPEGEGDDDGLAHAKVRTHAPPHARTRGPKGGGCAL